MTLYILYSRFLLQSFLWWGKSDMLWWSTCVISWFNLTVILIFVIYLLNVFQSSSHMCQILYSIFSSLMFSKYQRISLGAFFSLMKEFDNTPLLSCLLPFCQTAFHLLLVTKQNILWVTGMKIHPLLPYH